MEDLPRAIREVMTDFELCALIAEIEKEYKQIDWDACPARRVNAVGTLFPCLGKRAHDGRHVDCNGIEF